ncbi:hypothetical protein ACXXNA_05920 [Bordetella bronchiseptica]
MIERPILFSGPMVRAILAGTKTQTRRGKGLEYFSRPENDPEGWLCARVDEGHAFMAYKHAPHERAVKCPYGQPGDRLWVRETWAYGIHAMATYRDEDGPFVYAAGGTTQDRLGDRWRPSIHMPRSACRLVLEVTRVRVERLQAINHMDAIAEGLETAPGGWWSGGAGHAAPKPYYAFAYLWASINGPDSWVSNPWVWVVEFTRVR